MGDWRTMRIEDIARKIAMGPFGSNIKVETFVPRGVPIISGQHLHNARLDERPGFNFITEEHAEKLKNSNVFAGDIVFTHAGNIGQVAVIPDNVNYERYVISQRQFYLRVDTSKADPAFIARWFHGPLGKYRLLMHASQVGVPSISRPATNLKFIQIELPPLSEQSAISEVFDAIDDKIELNRRTNKTLEATARAIFKDWFVDFGPTRAKAEGRAPYLAPELWDLFPDRLNNQHIPAGWRVLTVGACFHLTMGQSPPGSTYNKERKGLPFFQGRTDFGSRYPENRVYCTEPTRIAELDDTLVSVRAPVGDINMAWEKCCAGRGVAALRHHSGSRSFTYYSAWAIQRELRQYEHTGTVFGAINKRQFEALSVLEPAPEIISGFESHIGPLDECIRKNVYENRSLAEARDLLLPKLISGEVRLAETNLGVS